MINNHIISLLKNKLKFEPNEDQLLIISKLVDFIMQPTNNTIFLLKGYAGTGKTSIIAALVQVLNEIKYKSVLLAPTGRAAKVLSKYANTTAFTIHKKIYRQKSLKDENNSFLLDKNLFSDTLFIVDEASMISNESFDKSLFGSGKLLDDLIQYVNGGKRCKLILIGDNAQLPPVGLALSPALDKYELMHYADCEEYTLTEVARQAHDSGILHNATLIRQQIDEHDIRLPKIQYNSFSDIEIVSGSDLMEKLSEAYDYYGTDETMIICRSNKRANRYNEGIRGRILYRDEEISAGDRLMIVKNCYQFVNPNEQMDFIANGDIAQIKSVRKHEERYDMRYVNVSLQFDDYNGTEIDAKIILDTLTIETASLQSETNKLLFYKVAEDYAHITEKRKRTKAILEDPFFSALQVKFAYAITCHKAQGGQWKCVFLDNPFFKKRKHYFGGIEMVVHGNYPSRRKNISGKL